ncbi:hypothetical protein [Nostoc sp.]
MLEFLNSSPINPANSASELVLAMPFAERLVEKAASYVTQQFFA